MEGTASDDMAEEDYWNSLAPTYDTLYDNHWSRVEDDQTSKIIGREFGMAAGSRVLDIGCGTGLGFALLARTTSDFSYTGIDVSMNMISTLARRHPRAKTICAAATLGLSNIPDRSLDYIMSINTSASFLGDARLIAQQLYRTLSENGRYTLSFLNRDSLRRILRFKNENTEWYRSRGDKRDNSPGVLARPMSLTDWQLIAKATSLSVEAIEYQSVLGGVLESSMTIPLEHWLSRIAPNLGHELIVSGARQC